MLLASLKLGQVGKILRCKTDFCYGKEIIKTISLLENGERFE
jgi:hypothetical protein